MEKIIWSNYADPLVKNMLYRGITYCSQGNIAQIEDTKNFILSCSAVRLLNIRNKLRVMVDNYIVASRTIVDGDKVYKDVYLMDTYMISDCLYSKLPLVKWYVTEEDFKSVEWLNDGVVFTTYRVLKPDFDSEDMPDIFNNQALGEDVFKECSNPLGTIVDSILLNN